MILSKKPPIKYTEMAMYIDKYIYSDNCDEEKVFLYLYHLALMLAYRSKLFKRPEYYEDFAVMFAEDMYIRLKNPKQKMVKEDGSPKMHKLTSVLNYMKKVLYGRKVTFEQSYYSQSLSTIAELEEELIVSNLNAANQIYKYTRDYNEVETVECLNSINIIIRDYIDSIPHLTNRKERENIYMSCLLTISYLFDNSIRAGRPAHNINKVILFHLNTDMEDYILVLCRRLLHEIENIFQIDFGPFFDEKEIISMAALETTETEDIAGIYE